MRSGCRFQVMDAGGEGGNFAVLFRGAIAILLVKIVQVGAEFALPNERNNSQNGSDQDKTGADDQQEHDAIHRPSSTVRKRLQAQPVAVESTDIRTEMARKLAIMASARMGSL